MIKIKSSAVTILTGPLDAVRDFHAVAKHTGDREQALPPASQWPNAADLLWNLSCSAPFQPTAETPLYSVQSAPGRFPFRHCSQPVTSAHVGGTVPDAFTSAFQAPCQSTKHLILFFFFILCIGPTTMQKDLLNGQKSEDVWKVSVTCL